MNAAAAIRTDYLVAGAGASAMAFIDTLLDHSDASVVVADRRRQPGGHWNDAYPFVRLHQPSGWYGVASTSLPPDDDPAGHGRGARGADVLAYFERLMHGRFLPSGRVRWLPGCDVQQGADGVHRVVALDGSGASTVAVRRRYVDATHARTEVPATHPPRYAVAPGVRLTTPRALAQGLHGLPPHATVVGAGKTAMDTVLWLMEQGLPPSQLRWIVPRDLWLFNRADMLTGPAALARSLHGTAAQFQAIADATSVADLFVRLEAGGHLLRIDPGVTPTAYRCTIASESEVALLRQVADVVRLGRVRAIEPRRIVLERGTVDAHPGTLVVDCSAAGLQPAPDLPVFDRGIIHLLMVSGCRPTFSAALVGLVECVVDGDDERNALCRPLPIPELPAHWLTLRAATLVNAQRWAAQPAVRAWLASCRLDLVAVLAGGARPDDEAGIALARQCAGAIAAASSNLPRLLAELDAADRAGRGSSPAVDNARRGD